MLRVLLPLLAAGGLTLTGGTAAAEETGGGPTQAPIQTAVHVVEDGESAVETVPVQFRRQRVRARGPGFRYRGVQRGWDPGFYGWDPGFHGTFYRGYHPGFYDPGFYAPTVYRGHFYRPYGTFYRAW